jgi:hypothetical protein
MVPPSLGCTSSYRNQKDPPADPIVWGFVLRKAFPNSLASSRERRPCHLITVDLKKFKETLAARWVYCREIGNFRIVRKRISRVLLFVVTGDMSDCPFYRSRLPLS